MRSSRPVSVVCDGEINLGKKDFTISADANCTDMTSRMHNFLLTAPTVGQHFSNCFDAHAQKE